MTANEDFRGRGRTGSGELSGDLKSVGDDEDRLIPPGSGELPGELKSPSNSFVFARRLCRLSRIIARVTSCGFSAASSMTSNVFGVWIMATPMSLLASGLIAAAVQKRGKKDSLIVASAKEIEPA